MRCHWLIFVQVDAEADEEQTESRVYEDCDIISQYAAATKS